MHPFLLGLNAAPKALLLCELFTGLAKDNLLLLPFVINILDGDLMLLLFDNLLLF